MEFNLAEKLAIVKVIDEVITADGELDKDEVKYLKHLMKVLDFEFNFIQEARKFNSRQAMLILREMSEDKKNVVANVFSQMAGVDGDIDQNEIDIIITAFIEAGMDVDESVRDSILDLSDLYFESSGAKEYKEGKLKSAKLESARCAIKVKRDMTKNDGYSVTSFFLEDETALWGDNVHIPSKQMKVVESNPDRTILKGFGEDPASMGNPEGKFSNFGLSIFHPNNKIEKMILHRFDNEIDIEYFR
ncbi:MAG: hypothetical protein HKN90_09815 [Flavobacteriaceae bacterium]|nr:hypothetical protein [Flavobacteriaceae bacterium]